MTTRRSFLASCLAAAAAPAYVKAGILMPVRQIVVPKLDLVALSMEETRRQMHELVKLHMDDMTFGRLGPVPKNQVDTYVFRRWLPYGSNPRHAEVRVPASVFFEAGGR